MLATYYTLSKDNAPTPEEMRQTSREYMLMKAKKYSYPENRNMQGGVNHRGHHGTSLEMIWTEIEQEIERQKLNETLSRSVPMPEAEVGATKSGSCNTLKMVTGKPFGITKIGARIMSIITVGDHEVARNLSEPSDQTTMHIDVYAGYLSAISPQTTSRALRALLTRGGSKSVRLENRYTEAYGPHEVM